MDSQAEDGGADRAGRTGCCGECLRKRLRECSNDNHRRQVHQRNAASDRDQAPRRPAAGQNQPDEFPGSAGPGLVQPRLGTTTKPNLDTRCTEDLDQFHQGLKYDHGNLSCLSCHNSGNTTRSDWPIRAGLSSSTNTLCSQCHGPQRRDYDRGLHGGMNGHWDLTRGGRTRNNCITCHDPHKPAYPLVMPVLPPQDRISVPVKPQTEPGNIKRHGNKLNRRFQNPMAFPVARRSRAWAHCWCGGLRQSHCTAY